MTYSSRDPSNPSGVLQMHVFVAFNPTTLSDVYESCSVLLHCLKDASPCERVNAQLYCLITRHEVY
ncbi:hypothetical protein BC835DRAFT_1346979 [Cytidiella melzeri]|nr:hypothetical protein BC835DRAFT_1346979 [Cytidiella melzeri]